VSPTARLPLPVILLGPRLCVEATDELALVQRVSRLLHAAHSDHLLVHVEEAVFGDLDVKGRDVGVISPERVFMKLDREWRRSVVRYLLNKYVESAEVCNNWAKGCIRKFPKKSLEIIRSDHVHYGHHAHLI
jgi:hypothetical protein